MTATIACFFFFFFFFCCCCYISSAFQQQKSCHLSPWTSTIRPITCTNTQLYGMKRHILDRLATFVFNLENDRVSKASVVDDKGRSGEPMKWAEDNSFANQLSKIVSNNDIGYAFKQTVADLVAGDYDREARRKSITTFIEEYPVAMYSFTTCPFCRKAKDYLAENSIPYVSIELDLMTGNEGNEIRSELGRMTKRTSVPSIFIGGENVSAFGYYFHCTFRNAFYFVLRFCVSSSDTPAFRKVYWGM
jgi:glutaredoxin